MKAILAVAVGVSLIGCGNDYPQQLNDPCNYMSSDIIRANGCLGDGPPGAVAAIDHLTAAEIFNTCTRE